jgi:hypothetical protein
MTKNAVDLLAASDPLSELQDDLPMAVVIQASMQSTPASGQKQKTRQGLQIGSANSTESLLNQTQMGSKAKKAAPKLEQSRR